MTILAPRWARLGAFAGVVLAGLQVVYWVVESSRPNAKALPWLMLVAAVYACLFFGWGMYLTLGLPVVRMTDQTIAWRALAGRRFQIVDLDDLVGCRYQDTFDFRLRLRSGEERSIFLNQIARRDRSRLVTAIEKAVVDRVPDG